MLVEKEM